MFLKCYLTTVNAVNLDARFNSYNFFWIYVYVDDVIFVVFFYMHAQNLSPIYAAENMHAPIFCSQCSNFIRNVLLFVHRV